MEELAVPPKLAKPPALAEHPKVMCDPDQLLQYNVPYRRGSMMLIVVCSWLTATTVRQLFLTGRYAMEKLSIYCLTSLLTFVLVSSSPAMDQNEPMAESDPTAATTLEPNGSPEEGDVNQKTVDLEGLPVVSLTGEQVGEMQSATTDERSGLIHYFTFAQRDESGAEGKVDVPYGALRIYSDRAVLIVEREKLESVPDQRNLSNVEYQENLQNHYGVAPVWSESE